MTNQLFKVPNGRKVRITSKKLRYIDDDLQERVIAGEVTWTGITTKYYGQHEGVRRRLIADTSVKFDDEDGIWQRDVKCYVIG